LNFERIRYHPKECFSEDEGRHEEARPHLILKTAKVRTNPQGPGYLFSEDQSDRDLGRKIKRTKLPVKK